MNKTKMKKVLGRGFILGGTVLMMSGYYLTVQSAMNYKTTAVAHADQVAPDTTNVVIHKTMYDQKDAQYFKDHLIKNDGTNKEDQFGDKLFHYNRNTMGKIEFTLYDITDQVNREFGGTQGLTGFTLSDGDKKEMNRRVGEIQKEIQNETNGVLNANPKILDGAQKIGTKEIDDNGDVRFDNLKAYDASKPQKYHYYVAVETGTPKGFVNNETGDKQVFNGRSIPLVFVAPFTNPEGTGFLKDINLYPKNNTQKLSFNLQKFAVWEQKDDNLPAEKKELAGAQFQLYGGKPGSGHPIGDVLTTDKDGKITADNLIMGDYYFVEVPSKVATDDGDALSYAKTNISPIAKNDKNNTLTFSIGENGIEKNKLNGHLVDYVTDLTKVIKSGVGDHHSHHIGDHATFTSTDLIPANIMGTEWENDTVNGGEKKTEAMHVFFNQDRPQEHLKDVEGERNFHMDGMEEGKDYQLITGDNSFFINYIVKDVSAQDKATLDEAAKTHDNARIKKALQSFTSGSASDKVAALAGKRTTFTYDMIVKKDAPTDKDIVNIIDLGWNDGSGYREIHRQDKLVTYGIHFRKQSSGFMGTGIAAQKLEGAEFHVQDKRTGKWFNGFKDSKDTKTGEPEIDWVNNESDINDDPSKIGKYVADDQPASGVLVSNKDGNFWLHGFTEGDYKLKEIKAPAGYQLMGETQDFHIGPDTYDRTDPAKGDPIKVNNDEKTSMPLTGSQQLLLLVVGSTLTVTVLGYAGYKAYKKHNALN